MSKPLPPLQTDEEARAFVAEANLADYDLSGGRMVRYAVEPTGADLHLRLPQGLIDALKAEAERAGISHQQFIRQTLESAVKAAG